MRQVMLIIGMSLFFIGSVYTQWSAGVQTAFLVTNAKIESGIVNLDNYVKPLTGYTIGGFGEYSINDNLDVQASVLFKRAGFHVSEGTTVELLGIKVPLGLSSRVAVNYIEMPLLLKYNRSFGNVNVFVGGGPGLSYAMNGSIKSTAQSLLDFDLNSTELDLKSDAYNRFGITANLSLGAEITTSDRSFLRVNLGYSTDLSSQVELPIVNVGVRNSAVSFGLGFGYRL